jgi:protein TonB
MSGTVVVALPIERRPVAGSDARTEDAMPVALASADRPVPPLPARAEFWSLIGLLIVSVVVHSTLLWVFVQAPEELPSIGIPAISVEIVVGDDAPAGLAAAPGQEEATQAVTSSAEPEQVVEETVRPDETRSRADVAAVSESPQAASPAAEPPSVAPEPVVLEAPKPLEVEAAPISPQTAEPPKPGPANAVQADEPDAKRPTSASAPASPSASGISRGRSAADANYAARVAAHLARHKQFPAGARRRGQQGSASISFSVDGSGRVTEVKLTRSAGSPLLDREAQSMVQRASPFPPPPAGRPQSFTVPVSFSMR